MASGVGLGWERGQSVSGCGFAVRMFIFLGGDKVYATKCSGFNRE